MNGKQNLAVRACGLAAVLWVGLVAGQCLAADAENVLKPTNKPESWRLEQHEGAKATMEAEGEAIVFNVTQTDDTDWHAQVFQTDLDFKEGAEYTVTFKAKADAERELRIQASIDEEDWHNIGLDEAVQAGKEWKEYSYSFKAADVKAKKNRLGFVLGGAKGKVWVENLVVKAK